MNAAILSSTIGGSAILVAAVVGALMSHLHPPSRQNQTKIEAGIQQVAAAIRALDTKFTWQIDGLSIYLAGLHKQVNDRLNAHGERLARTEEEPKINPPPTEAA